MTHYNLESQPLDIRAVAATDDLTGPCFVGQGCTKCVGSDAYGLYVTAIKTLPNGKPLIGLTAADTKFTTSWADGDMDCSIDIDTAKPTKWITYYRKCWWECDELGNRKRGRKVHYNWNGARAYRDPSF